ncbi:hypothetical protein D3C87_1657430 [compost metagenome]
MQRGQKDVERGDRADRGEHLQHDEEHHAGAPPGELQAGEGVGARGPEQDPEGRGAHRDQQAVAEQLPEGDPVDLGRVGEHLPEGLERDPPWQEVQLGRPRHRARVEGHGDDPQHREEREGAEQDEDQVDEPQL